MCAASSEEEEGTDILATVLPKFNKLIGNPSRRRAGGKPGEKAK
jgi:hypothetical protein